MNEKNESEFLRGVHDAISNISEQENKSDFYKEGYKLGRDILLIAKQKGNNE